MTLLRMLLIITAAGGVGYAAAGMLFLTVTDFGVGLAVTGFSWLLYGLITYVESESREAMRAERDRVWQRRIRESARVGAQ